MPSISTRPSNSSAVGELFVLQDERRASQVTIAPQRGALVTSFRVGERELLYLDAGTLLDAGKNVRGGIPVLFPAPGKLEGDSWHRAGHTGAMKQHGFARNVRWTVSEQTSSPLASLTLTLESNDETRAQYPWNFKAELSYTLDNARLKIRMRVFNTDTTAMPFALGFHPYFHVTDKAHARIDTRATQAFDNVTKQTVPFTGFDFTAQELDMHLLDHGSTNATLALADGSRIQLKASSDFAYWVVWTLRGKEFVCLEPWTAPGNALNSGISLRSVEPGRQAEEQIEIELAV
jgi:galactose mutarotase-like enzyme